MASVHKRNRSGSIEYWKNPLISIHNEIDKAMNHFYEQFEPKRFEHKFIENIKLLPPMDLTEDKHCFRLEVEMPGMREEDIAISLNGNTLTVKGEKTLSKKNGHKNYLSREINYGCYERSISLPLSADLEKTSAIFKEGLLCIEIPKKQTCKTTSREIKIKKG